MLLELVKKDTYWQQGHTTRKKEAKTAIHKMIGTLIKLWPRTDGQGWFKAKVHEQLHVPRDIERNGSPRESYSGPLEHNHLELKNHSRKTQRNWRTHDKQVGQRVAESYIINYCFDRMQHKQSDLPIQKLQLTIPQQSSKGLLTLSRGSKGKICYSFIWTTKTLAGKEDTINFQIMAFECLSHQFKNKITSQNSVQIKIFTEYTRNDSLFRAHPFYSKSDSPWYDWVMLRFGKDRHSYKCTTYKAWLGDDDETALQHSYAPAKILLFCQDPDDGNIYAVCLCCAFEHKE